MKILIITPGTYPVPAIEGGAVENLIEMLLRDSNITLCNEITVYTVYKEGIEKYIENIRANFKFIYTNSKIYKLNRIIRFIYNKYSKKEYIGNEYIHRVIKDIKKSNSEYDLIIVENAVEYGQLLVPLKKNAKLYLHLHNDYINSEIKDIEKIVNSYDKIIVISNFIKNRIKEVSKHIDIDVLYNGIEIEKFIHKVHCKEKIKNKYGIEDDDFVYIFSGRLVEDKGVKELIEAFCLLENKRNTKLLIVGKPRNTKDKYYRELKKKAMKRKDDIIFTGNIKYDEVSEIYSIGNIGILPSMVNEAFGLVLVEFLALGMPVIASKKGGITEIISDNVGTIVNVDNNFVQNLKSAMEYYLNINNETVRNMSLNSIQRSKLYSCDNYCNNFKKILENIKEK